MKRFLIVPVLLATLIVANCAQYQATTIAVKEGGAKAMDEALNTSIWFMCNGASVGSIKRKFTSKDQMAAYKTICLTVSSLEVLATD